MSKVLDEIKMQVVDKITIMDAPSHFNNNEAYAFVNGRQTGYMKGWDAAIDLTNKFFDWVDQLSSRQLKEIYPTELRTTRILFDYWVNNILKPEDLNH